jgi:uncharacterized protein (TIGR02757 family)
VHPDPLQFLYNFPEVEDREIAGLVASGLAYGRVSQILKGVGKVFDFTGRSPSEFLRNTGFPDVKAGLSKFKYRFTGGNEMAAFLVSISSLQKENGLLGNYMAGLVNVMSYIQALDVFAGEVVSRMEKLGSSSGHLLPRPSRGSACKRLHLFMRWMVRQDEVDPGGWSMILPSELVVPVDVHMHRMGRHLGFTSRKAADAKTAAEITAGFRKLCPGDPVKYDFALTRFGIQQLTDSELFKELLG